MRCLDRRLPGCAGALLGRNAPNLSPALIARLTAAWADEYARWQGRNLSARRYAYVWADGVYLQARMEEQAECMLVLIGATPEGRKELVGFQVGVRESAQSWRELLVDVKRRGLLIAPEMAVGDGALGFWRALDEVFPGTAHQRCWVHKAANVLDKVPKSVQPAMKADLREIHGADPGGGRGGAGGLRRKVRGQVPPRPCLPDQGSGGAAGVLRLLSRALGPPAQLELDRERVRHGAASDCADQRGALGHDRQADGVQAGDGGVQNLAPAEGRKPVAEGRGRRHLPRRDRSRREPRSPRRLTAAVT
jgi:putative transposase